MSVVNDANRDLLIQMIAVRASCTRETVARLFEDKSVDELNAFYKEVGDGKKAIQYGKIVEL